MTGCLQRLSKQLGLGDVGIRKVRPRVTLLPACYEKQTAWAFFGYQRSD
jgi:hypothetical protein